MTAEEKAVLKAAKAGDLKGVKALVAKEKSLLKTRDTKDGSTLLHCAAWKGHLEIVAFLLDAGLAVDAENENGHWGTTALCAAAHADNKEVAELLIARGAKVDFRSPLNKLTPLGHTKVHGAKGVAKLLAEHRGKI